MFPDPWRMNSIKPLWRSASLFLLLLAVVDILKHFPAPSYSIKTLAAEVLGNYAPQPLRKAMASH